jgi:hypothetical protein
MEFSRVWVIDTAVESGVVVFGGSFKCEAGWWELQVSAEKLDGAEAHYVDRSLMGPNHSFSLMPSPAKHTQYVAPFLPPDLYFAFYLQFVCMS